MLRCGSAGHRVGTTVKHSRCGGAIGMFVRIQNHDDDTCTEQSPPQPPLRIGVVEDHESVVLGLSTLLADQADLLLVASAPTVDELLAITSDLDLAILDLRLRDGSSPTGNVQRLSAAGIGVLVFTGGGGFVSGAIGRCGRGAGGWSASPSPTTWWCRRFGGAAAGDSVITTDWATAVDSDPDLSIVGLSPQQLRVLELYASGGETTNRVARLTGLAAPTVTEYLGGRIRTKYAEAGRPAPTKTELYKRAVEDGHLPIPRSSHQR